MYKLMKPPYIGVESNIVLKVEEKLFIPMVESNIDYQEYLKWLEEGNTPLPADEGTQ